MKRTTAILRRAMNRARFVLLALLGVHLAAGALFSIVEGRSVLDGQYWATVTGFTVGYGDILPQSNPMKCITMFYIPLMAFLWLFLAAHVVASVIEDKHLFTNEEQERNEACLLALARHAGIVPNDAAQLPTVSWWEQNHGFQATPD